MANTPQPSLAWQFEGSTTDYISGLSPTTITGTPTYVTGKYGQAIQFTNSAGSTASQRLAYSTSLSSASGFTYSFWVQFNTYNVGFQTPISLGDASSYLNIYGTSVIYLYWLRGTNAIQASSSFSYSIGTWYHIVVTYVSQTVTLYINGISTTGILYISGVPSGTNVGADTTFTTLYAGSQNTSLAFNGLIDDLRIYNTALNSTQINNIYQMGGISSILSLTLTQKIPIDTSPNPLNLQSYTTNIQNSQISPFLYENSMSFNGTNSRIYSATCPSKLQINFWTVPWTFEGWVMANINQNNNAIFLRNDTYQNPCPDIYVYLAANGGLTVSGGTSTTGNWYLAGPGIAINTWQYFAVTFDGVNTLKIYTGTPGGNTTLNAQKTDITSGVNGQYNPTAPFIIGSHTGAYFNGKLASLRFTSNAVLYNSTFSVPITPLGNSLSGTTLLSIHASTSGNLTHT